MCLLDIFDNHSAHSGIFNFLVINQSSAYKNILPKGSCPTSQGTARDHLFVIVLSPCSQDFSVPYTSIVS